MDLRKKPKPFTLEVRNFLIRKGMFFNEKHYTYVRLLISRESLSIFLYLYVIDSFLLRFRDNMKNGGMSFTIRRMNSYYMCLLNLLEFL
jgi:hypothetical protein